LSTRGTNRRQLVVMTKDGNLDAFVGDIDGGNVINEKQATTTPPLVDRWETLAFSLTTARARVRYGAIDLLDVEQSLAVFDQAVLQLGLVSFDPTRTVEAATRYDDVRCTVLP
jgi:hypothetical protein